MILVSSKYKVTLCMFEQIKWRWWWWCYMMETWGGGYPPVVVQLTAIAMPSISLTGCAVETSDDFRVTLLILMMTDSTTSTTTSTNFDLYIRMTISNHRHINVIYFAGGRWSQRTKVTITVSITRAHTSELAQIQLVASRHDACVSRASWRVCRAVLVPIWRTTKKQ